MPTQISILVLVSLASAIVHLGGCASSDHHAPVGAVAAPVPAPAAHPAAERAAAEVARAVEQKAMRSQQAEGKQDLVADEVRVTTDGTGAPVVEQQGEASWYGKQHHGRKTASGARFDQRGMTAAHPTLPLGTKATVTNLETGKSAEVTINDRGPYVKGRDIDVSKAAAEKIGFGKDGAAPVKIEAKVPTAP